MQWRPGETALQRFVRKDGSLGQHHPLRVLEDDGEQLLGWLPQNTEVIGTRLPDGRDPRQAPLDQMFLLPRIRFRTRWKDTSTLRLIGGWSSVWWFFDPAGDFMGWYVNLEIPLGRTQSTLDRVDGALDVVVAPDRSWRWKDEDEVPAALAAGRISSDDLRLLRAEGRRMADLAEAGRFPFDGAWCDFRPDPAWPAPTLPLGLEA